MKKVRECVAKCITILMVLNLVSWLVGENMVAMAKCKDPEKCVHGYHTFWDYYLKTKKGNIHGTRYVYVSNDFKTETIRAQIKMGYHAWNTSGNNKVRLANTTDKNKWQIKIVPESLGPGVYGVTYLQMYSDSPYIEDNIKERLRSNYIHARVEIHEAKCQREGLISKTVLHESGHALGLSHVTCKKSAMCPGMDSPNMLATPSNADRATLRHVYNAYK